MPTGATTTVAGMAVGAGRSARPWPIADAATAVGPETAGACRIALAVADAAAACRTAPVCPIALAVLADAAPALAAVGTTHSRA